MWVGGSPCPFALPGRAVLGRAQSSPHSTGGFLLPPGMSTLPQPRNASIGMCLLAQQRANSSGLAGGLSGERAHGKLCLPLSHPGTLKASHCMHIPFHFSLVLSFVLLIFHELDMISKGLSSKMCLGWFIAIADVCSTFILTVHSKTQQALQP